MQAAERAPQALAGRSREIKSNRSASHALHSSAAVVARRYTLAGGGAVFAGSSLQRGLRNVQVASQHTMVNDATFELTGRLLLGLPTQVNRR